MAFTVIDSGEYLGLDYILVEYDGKRYIGLEVEKALELLAGGADMTILNDIGSRNPHDIIAAIVHIVSN